MIQLHAVFYGRVQGVGFRWTVVDYAFQHKLTGTAKNLPDGTVEVFAQGSKEALEAFLESIQSDPGIARIERVASEYQKLTTPFNDFKIIY